MTDERADPPSRGTHPFAVAVAAVVIALSIGGPLVGRGVFAAADLVDRVAPWSCTVAEDATLSNRYVGDTIDGGLPARREFAARARDGDFAMRNPYVSGGHVLGGWPNQGSLSVLNVPYLALPLRLAPGWSKALEMGVAIAGMWGLTRGLGMSGTAGVLAGIAYATCGFQVVWTNWPHTHVGAWIPMWFWAADAVVSRWRPRHLVALAAVTAAMLLDGFPAIVVYAAAVLGPFVVVRAAWAATATDELRHALEHGRDLVVRIGRAGAGLALGVGLAAVQVVPFLTLLGSLHVGERTQGVHGHLKLEAAITTISPWVYGSTDWRYGGSSPPEQIAFVGAAALGLAVLGVAWRRGPAPGVRVLGAVAAVWLAITIFAGSPLLWILQRFPGFSTNGIARARGVMAFCVAVLAAAGIERILRDEPSERSASSSTRRLIGIVATVLMLVAGQQVLTAALDRATERDVVDHVWSGLAWAALAIASVLAVGLARRRRILSANVAAAALALLVGAEALAITGPWFVTTEAADLYPVTSVHRFLAAEQGHGRYAATRSTMFPGSATAYRLRSIDGHVFTPAAWRELVEVVDPEAFRTTTYVTLHHSDEILRSRVLDRLGVNHVVVDERDPVSGAAGPPPDHDGSAEVVAGEAIATVALPASAVRALRVWLEATPALGSELAWLEVTIRDAADAAVVTHRRRLRRDDVGELHVALPEAHLIARAAGPLSAEVRLVADPGDRMRVRTQGPLAVADWIRESDDGLRLAHVGDAVVYERRRALPRIRISGQWMPADVAGPFGARLTALAADHVALVRPGDAADVERVIGRPAAPADRVPQRATEPASVEVLVDEGDEIRVGTVAPDGGLLVVADSFLPGWTASVDGQDVPVVVADHGLVGVPLAPGTAEVVLSYRVPRLRAGAMISAVSAAVAVALLVLDRRHARRAR